LSKITYKLDYILTIELPTCRIKNGQALRYKRLEELLQIK